MPRDLRCRIADPGTDLDVVEDLQVPSWAGPCLQTALLGPGQTTVRMFEVDGRGEERLLATSAPVQVVPGQTTPVEVDLREALRER